MKTACTILAGAAAMGLSGPAAAAVSFVSTDFGFEAPAGASTITFDDATPAGFTLTGGLIQNTNNSLGAEPAVAQGVKETTNYLSANAGNAATITSTGGYRQLSVYWGSIDAYNTISLLDRTGGTIASYTGDQIHLPANGDQFDASTNRRVTFTTDGDTSAIYGVRFESSRPAFEVDNVGFSAAVPEPATWAMMIGGIGLGGGALRRRRSITTRLAFA